MKTKILIAAVMFLALSVAAFAQVTAQFNVGSVPVTTVASCGVTERTGDILFTTVAGTGATASGTFTINYGVPITSPLSSIQLSGTAATIGALTVGSGATLFLDPALNTTSTLANGLLTISYNVAPQAITVANNPVQIQLTGVRVNISGSALTSLSATISSTGNAIAAGQTTVIVVNSIATALASTVVTTPSSINAATGVVTNTPLIKVKENFVTGFEFRNVAGTGSEGGIVQLLFTVPSGVTVTLPLTATTDLGATFVLVTVTPDTTSGLIGAASVAAATSGAFSSTTGTVSAFYRATTPGTNSAQSIDTLLVAPTSITVAATSLPLAGGTLTVQAQLAPSSPSSVVFGSSTYIPRYAGTQCATGTATLATISSANTFLLITYAVNTNGYDTAMSIANTSKDAPALGASTPIVGVTTPNNGTLTFTFFPQATAAQITAGGTSLPVPFQYTTSATTNKGTGLTSAGVLNAGNTYSVLLSDLLNLAGGTITGQTAGTFQGYIIVQCNFTNAHGQYNIVNFQTGASIGSILMEVFVANRNTTPEALTF